jgi:predicted amidophosphoribosyltransferase
LAAIREASDFFYSFKTGDGRLAYPLARGIFQALRRVDGRDFDVIVPIPLSPDKAVRGELHRTLAIARELSDFLGSPVLEALTLSEPFSKRAFRARGGTEVAFEREYGRRLRTTALPNGVSRVLLVDDVCTEGATLRAAWRCLVSSKPNLRGAIVTAGQMIVKAVVSNTASLCGT